MQNHRSGVRVIRLSQQDRSSRGAGQLNLSRRAFRSSFLRDNSPMPFLPGIEDSTGTSRRKSVVDSCPLPSLIPCVAILFFILLALWIEESKRTLQHML